MRTICRFRKFYSALIRPFSTTSYSATSILGSQRKVQAMSQSSAKQADTPVAIESTILPVAKKGTEKKEEPKILRMYDSIQAQYPEHFVLMQVGDFFEVFNEAAEQVSKILEIGLCTVSRYKTLMTGFPIKSMDTHIEKLVKAGKSAVIVEQFGSGPRNITRKITRVITPGTLTEENLLESRCNNFILAIKRKKNDDKLGLAWIDLSTGYFRLMEISKGELLNDLSRINPKEVIADDFIRSDPQFIKYCQLNGATITDFQKANVDNYIKELFGSSTFEFSELETEAAQNLLGYIFETQLDQKPFIETPLRHNRDNIMKIDAPAMKSLEILKNNTTNTRENSVLDVLDVACTAAGSRLLIQRLQSPLLNVAEIELRLDSVQFLVERTLFLAEIREILKYCKDIERCFQRLALNRTSGGPKNMIVVRETLEEAMKIKDLLIRTNFKNFQDLGNSIMDGHELIQKLRSALVDCPPSRVSEGQVIKPGYSRVLDELRASNEGIEAHKMGLLSKYKKISGRDNLKFTERKTLGWLLEISKSEGPLKDPMFILDSQVDNKFRYRTGELETLYRRLNNGDGEVLREEVRIYESLRDEVIKRGREIMNTAKVLAEVDVLAAIAKFSKERGYSRPKIVEDNQFLIVRGRHPVVEMKHLEVGRCFVHNSCNIGDEHGRFALITGPNMGGKSTFLRQNAIISIMAQCGMFVPAESASIGIIDGIYTRIGASDDLSRDKSTFMVEMMETAAILKNATDKSLVIMDEVGRGTSSSEGFALAKGICKYLHDKKCRTLFATHYFELSEMINSLESTQCLMAGISYEGNMLSFLHSIIPGVADKSHAIDIARLAGIPEEVLEQARSHVDCSKLNQIKSIVKDVSSDIDHNSTRDYRKLFENIRLVINAAV